MREASIWSVLVLSEGSRESDMAMDDIYIYICIYIYMIICLVSIVSTYTKIVIYRPSSNVSMYKHI